ncbi:MAG: PhnD/SsuA/transferrin family substrate-binding protein [Opitutae bacterium]|nr:PhnD/SsuA/transferrin family substrate-binding protein [Opitutae bacterium]
MKRALPLLALLALLAVPARTQPPTGEVPDLRARVAYTRTILRTTNENDFRTAMRAYTKVIADNFHIITVPDELIYDTSAQLEDALRRGTIEVVAGTAREVLAVDPALLDTPYFASHRSGAVGSHYVIVVHAQSNIAQLADLSGCRVAVFDGPQGCLARPWLEVACAQASLPALPASLRELRLVAKPSQAVLPVFFRQIEACITTRESLAVLAELNPQISRQLRIIATSPRLVPVLTALRHGIDPALHARVIEAITTVDSLPAGRQVLTLFQTEEVHPVDEDTLAGTRQLLADHARLAARAKP